MQIIQNIREKGAAIVIVVIALSLIGFILMDAKPGSSGGIFGGNPGSDIGKINGEKIEYRVWNPFRSKIAASVIGGIAETGIYPGAKVLYLGGASGTTVSHVSDIIGPEGVVYAV